MYSNDVFISYSHIDNLPLSEEQLGWITRFHNTLSVFLSQRLGAKARIWRDQKLQGNDIFDAEITRQFRDTALFISILTPRYVHSDWCRREIKEFCEQAQAAEGLVLDNKSRVLKVIKTPIDEASAQILPEVVKNSLGYDFYLWQGQGPMELDPDFGESFKQDYLRKVCMVANDAAALIQQVEKQHNQNGDASAAPVRQTVVFLASCSSDQRDNRELIETDLRCHGYQVLPQHSLPCDQEDNHRNAVAPLLAKAKLAVHLIGQGYGLVPDGPSFQSVVEIENAMAAECSRTAGLKRLIWLPAATASDHPAQARFLNALRKEAACQWGADLFSGSLEELRTQLHILLDAMEKPAPVAPQPLAAATGLEDSQLIYLICVEQDRKATLPLRKSLKGEGFEVCLPAFDGSAAAVRDVHEGVLRDCRAALVFYGAGDEAWHRAIKTDLRKAPAYRGGRPLPPPFTYLSLPDSDDKTDMVEMEEPDLIDGRQGFTPALLQPFVQRLRQSEAGP